MKQLEQKCVRIEQTSAALLNVLLDFGLPYPYSRAVRWVKLTSWRPGTISVASSSPLIRDASFLFSDEWRFSNQSWLSPSSPYTHVGDAVWVECVLVRQPRDIPNHLLWHIFDHP